jgi:hypothetical protein
MSTKRKKQISAILVITVLLIYPVVRLTGLLKYQVVIEGSTPLVSNVLPLPEAGIGDPIYFSAWLSPDGEKLAVVTGNFFKQKIYWSHYPPSKPEDYILYSEISPKICVLTSFAWNPFNKDEAAFILRELDIDMPPSEQFEALLKDIEKKEGKNAVEQYLMSVVESNIKSKPTASPFDEVLYTFSLKSSEIQRIGKLAKVSLSNPKFFRTANRGLFFNCLTWSSDSKFLVYRTAGELYKVNLQSKKHTLLFSFMSDGRNGITSTITALPDNKFSYQEDWDDSGDAHIITFDENGKTLDRKNTSVGKHDVDYVHGKNMQACLKGFDSGMTLQIASKDSSNKIFNYEIDPRYEGSYTYTPVGFDSNESHLILTKMLKGIGSAKLTVVKNKNQLIDLISVPIP